MIRTYTVSDTALVRFLANVRRTTGATVTRSAPVGAGYAVTVYTRPGVTLAGVQS